MKKSGFLLSILVLMLSFSFYSCNQGNNDVDEKQQQQQETQLEEANKEVGVPALPNFQEKKLLKHIYELRDQENLICYAYLFSPMTGKLIFIGKCIGYGIPYSTQFSNPEKIVNDYTSSFGTLPQAEPNGLFMPNSSQGTWVMLLDSSGTPHPVYIEPDVIVSPFKLDI